MFENISFSVFPDGDTCIRRYHDHRDNDRPYAVSRFDWDNGRELVQYLAGDEQFFAETQNCVSHIALEELLLRFDRLILHASFVATQFGGILFSGPSGIGKSTQADLWVRHADAWLINGDRTILAKNGTVWTAYGSPYAGSSRCFINEAHPVRAIVMLKQGSSCRIARLSTAAAFQRLYACTTVNSWNPVYVDRICTLLVALAGEVPVYELTCTPDREAVKVLRSVLEEDG